MQQKYVLGLDVAIYIYMAGELREDELSLLFGGNAVLAVDVGRHGRLIRHFNQSGISEMLVGNGSMITKTEDFEWIYP